MAEPGAVWGAGDVGVGVGCVGGRMPGRGSSSGVWSEVAILRLFQGVLQGVKQLHTSDPPLAHRDIKVSQP